MFKKKIRWGILATGGIAAQFAEALNATKDATIVACASRSQEKADAFAKKWSVQRAYAGYEQLVTDEAVDVVYIATPHHLHYDNMRLCFEAGKHVVCEKPLTLNARESAEMIALARSKQRFLLEAVWMRFMPAIRQLKTWVADGLLGDINLITANFHFNHPFDASHRLYNPQLGGGALLDLGIYPLNFAINLLGFPQSVDGSATLGSTGVDETSAYMLSYASGAKAMLTSGMRSNRPISAIVSGSKGYIEVPPMFLRPDHLMVHLDGKKPKKHKLPFRNNGYVHEIDEVHDCLRAGKLESDIMPLDETLQMMQLFDQLRAKWGIQYPNELR